MASLFFVFVGIFLLVTVIWGKAWHQRLGLRPPKELLTSKRLQQSAQIEEKLGLVTQSLLRLGLLLHGITLSSWGSPLTVVTRAMVLGLLVICVLGLLATKIYFWRA